MPIRPQPFTFVCQACHWKKTVAPLSDALGPLDWCERCERCGSDVLTVRWRNGLPDYAVRGAWPMRPAEPLSRLNLRGAKHWRWLRRRTY